MFVPAPTDERFAMIQDTLASYDNILSVSELCRIANVSRSGYYRWVAAAESRAKRETQDQNDFALILQAYNHRGYAKGARSIYMRLLHLEPPVCMNLKKIRRIMNKYGLKCPIRKANPYRQMLNAMRTSHVAPQSSAAGVPGAWPAEGLVDRYYLPDIWFWSACLHGNDSGRLHKTVVGLRSKPVSKD